ncbi:MAG: helix-turn-helix domain-containing protein [Bacteroidota bacterium]
MEIHKLNEVAALAADYINTTNRHIFLTGKAGTGKTTFLRYIVKHTFKNTLVAAPTGIAAINAGGVTLHSLLQLPFGAFIPENIPFSNQVQIRLNTPRSLGRHHQIRGEKIRLLQQMELLIIDEVSMLRSDLLDCIDFRLRSVRRRKEPFGGVQLLFIGDLMQLPPVVKDPEWRYLQQYYTSPFFFSAQALKNFPPITVELQKIYRQSDQEFIDLLNRLRNNQQRPEDLHFLNQSYQEDADLKGYIHLTTHNHKADKINQTKLEELQGKARTFETEIEDDFPEHLYPLPKELRLKKGAQVMFVKNDPSGEGRYFNGKIGEVSYLGEEEIQVRFEDGREVFVDSYQWENIRFALNPDTNQVEEQTLGTFSQFPLKLAWAVTIHKSQGLTFEKAILDVSDSFAPGQLYVALSRLTSLKGLVLSSRIPTRPPAISPALIAFAEDIEDPATLQTQIDLDRSYFIQNFASNAFSFHPVEKALNLHLDSFTKEEARSVKQQYLSWTQELRLAFQPLLPIGLKFYKQVYELLQGEQSLEQLALRSVKAQEYFEPQFLTLLRKIQAHLNTLEEKKRVKAYKKELEDLEASFLHQIRQIAKFSLLIQEISQGRIPTADMLEAWEVQHKLRRVPPPKKPKVPTAEITYQHYLEGLTPEEIAEKRDLTLGTISAHLCKYVAQGKIDCEELMDVGKINEIIEVLGTTEIRTLGSLKGMLGDAYSYAEIRFVLAKEKSELL